ncbi:hypothetical protein DMN91_007961 [Ooceraea biroi]|uniref:Reverse transcriptase domain-containing protein n=1 Tax=Ooceraea biroi TaxID=2015173 RepID=A0A3L8DG69_OOCBI|nr:hypothetical protein DMN91_007961 [Ooceraea biroi]
MPGEASVPVERNVDEQTALDSRGGDLVSSPSPHAGESQVVSFPDPVVTEVVKPDTPAVPASESYGLLQDLFKEQSQPPAATSWLPVILNTLRSEARSGLTEELKSDLLVKHEPKEDVAFLRPPCLNKEILPNLAATVLTRDKHQMKAQAQVGASLNALGSGLSDLSKIEASPTARTASPETDELTASRGTATPTAVGKQEVPSSLDVFGSSREEGPAPLQVEPLQEIGVPFPNADSALNPKRSAGRLAGFASSWREITSNPQVLEAITGYKIPFSRLPPPRPFLRESAFSVREAAHCTAEIERLCRKGALVIAEPTAGQFLSSFFLIPKSSGGMRFILNLRDLNEYISPHFKMEDWRTVVSLMTPNSWMASVDLEDAYLLVPVHPSHKRFLRFRWRNIVYEFTSLPFGLSTAPYIFTKIVRPVVRVLRAKGFPSVVYLDDFLLLGDSKESCQKNVRETLDLLSSLGFLINYSKSELVPSSKRKYLGFIFDSVQQSVSIPPDRRRRLRTLILNMSRKSRCTIKEFASILGSLTSVCPAVLYGLLYTKRFGRQKFLALEAHTGDFDQQMSIPVFLKEDFDWWLRIFSDKNQNNTIRLSAYAREIFSDASLTGWGAACGDQRTHGWWTADTRTLHINALELLAAFYALRCFATDLRACNILLRLNNTTAIAYINKFGSVQYLLLSDIARDIWKWCEERNLYLFASYIASVDNVIADTESRVPDTDTKWSLSSQAFKRIDRDFGPFDIDLFASVANTKHSVYASWFPDPGSWAVDAFTLSWHQFYFYAFPSFVLIPRVLRRILDEEATGVVVVPWWPAQSWFPMFLNLLASDPIILPPSRFLLSPPFRERHPEWRNLSLAAGRLSGRPSNCRPSLQQL